MSEILLIVILGVIAVGAVAYPVLVGRTRYADSAELDADIGRYRDALEAGTVCPGCQHANPPEAGFCAECGRELEG